jgi:hypothetical protein
LPSFAGGIRAQFDFVNVAYPGTALSVRALRLSMRRAQEGAQKKRTPDRRRHATKSPNESMTPVAVGWRRCAWVQ